MVGSPGPDVEGGVTDAVQLFPRGGRTAPAASAPVAVAPFLELSIVAPVKLPIKDAGQGPRRLRRCFASLTGNPTDAIPSPFQEWLDPRAAGSSPRQGANSQAAALLRRGTATKRDNAEGGSRHSWNGGQSALVELAVKDAQHRRRRRRRQPASLIGNSISATIDSSMNGAPQRNGGAWSVNARRDRASGRRTV